MSKKLTPWFPNRTRPVREGEYDYRGWLLEDPARLTWNGNQWGYWLGKSWVQMGEMFSDSWRGLASNPARKS